MPHDEICTVLGAGALFDLEFYPDWPVGLDNICSFSWLDDHDDDEEQLHFFVTAAFVISADKRAERVRISGIGSTFPVSWLYTVLTWYIWVWGYSGKAKATVLWKGVWYWMSLCPTKRTVA